MIKIIKVSVQLKKNNPPIVVIGGTDPSGAGLSTDIAVAHSLNTSVLPIITAVTAQKNNALIDASGLDPEHIAAQLKCIDFSDIHFVKIGMLGTKTAVDVVIKQLPSHVQIVLDPVLRSSSQGKLMADSGLAAMQQLLLSRALLITPNTDELAILSGQTIHDTATQFSAAKALLKSGAQAVFAKGGHIETASELSTDIYCDVRQHFALSGKRWPDRSNVRGTGCATATAITCLLNQDYEIQDALVMAKSAVNQSIALALNCGEENNGAYRANHQGLAKHHQYIPRQHPVGAMPRYSFPDCYGHDQGNSNSNELGIYPVVDSAEWIKKLVPLGIKTIQLRIKTGTANQIESEILESIRFCEKHQVRLFINDYWQLAIKHGAYGVHLGQEDIQTANMSAIAKAGLRLGLSSHCWSEIARALAFSPSYLALGPIYATTSKDMPWTPLGAKTLRQWVKRIDNALPLVAIGGINIQRIKDLKRTGVGSVAMISAITETEDYKPVTLDLIQIWQAAE